MLNKTENRRKYMNKNKKNPLQDHPNLKELNLSHNHLDEEGGIAVAKWMSKFFRLI